jgi:hypothetical protein
MVNVEENYHHYSEFVAFLDVKRPSNNELNWNNVSDLNTKQAAIEFRVG